MDAFRGLLLWRQITFRFRECFRAYAERNEETFESAKLLRSIDFFLSTPLPLRGLLSGNFTLSKIAEWREFSTTQQICALRM